MRILFAALAILAASLCAQTARAQTLVQPRYFAVGNAGIVITGGTLCAGGGIVYTVDLERKYSTVRAGMNLTWGAATFQITGTCLIDGTNPARLAKRDLSAGTVTPLGPEAWAPGASQYLSLEFGVKGCRHFRLTVLGAGCTADALAVDIAAVAGN